MKSSGISQNHRTSRTEKSFQEYLALVVRGRWLALGILGFCVITAALYSYFATPIYKATATILIEQKSAAAPISVDPAARPGMQNNRNELEVLKSRSIADTVAARLLRSPIADSTTGEMYPIVLQSGAVAGTGSLASKGEVIGRLYSILDFEPLRETDIVRVIAESTNPHEAAAVANLYAKAYFDRNILTSRSKSRAFREFLEEQVRSKRVNLDETESQLQQYMEAEGVVSLDAESQKVISQLSQLEAQRDATEISIKSKSRELASLKEQFPQQEAGVARLIGEANDQYIKGLQTQIAQLEVQRDVTIAQNPDYVGQDIYKQKLEEIDTQIKALKVKLQARTDEFIQTLPAASIGGQSDPAGYLKQLKQGIVEGEIELQSLGARKNALDAVIRQYNVQFDRIPKQSIQLARLQRSKMSNEKLFLLLESKYSEAAIAEQSEFGYATIIDPAVVPGGPSSPKLMLNLLIGAALGLMFGLGAVFLKEYLDVKVQAPEDLKRKGHAVLASVMRMEDELRQLDKENEAGRYSREIDPHLLTLLLPFSPISEAYRLLRTALHFPKSTEPPRVVLVTSPNPGEGKTTTVCNLAVSFAQTGKKTLLIDCDLRKPNVHTLFNLEMKPGLSDLLLRSGSHELAVRAGVVKNLDVLCAGLLSPNPAEVLGSDDMAMLLEQARREYDVILLDTSPVLAATDASVLSTKADAVVLVTAAGSTRVTDVDHATELLESVGGKLLGIVLNRLDLQQAYGIPYGRSGYGYYGYAYGGDGRKNGSGAKAKKRRRV